MSTLRSAEGSVEGYDLHDFALPTDFRMPTTEEIERDLALGKPGWKSLLRSSESEHTQCDSNVVCVQSTNPGKEQRTWTN
jgi:hypothetical protein